MAQTKAQLISGTATQELALSKATLGAGTSGAPALTTSGDTNTGIFFPAADTIAFAEGGVESVRIDSSGRLLVGTSTTVAANRTLQVAGTGAEFFYNAADTDAVPLILSKSRGSLGSPTIVSSGDNTGFIRFRGYDGSGYVDTARIESAVDGTPGTNDMPGRLVFSTTADGASSPTERFRINSYGLTQVLTTLGQGTEIFGVYKSGTPSIAALTVDAGGWNGAASATILGRNSSTLRSINAGGTINASGADYAEYMTKAGEFEIAKGDVCGVTADGKLTNVFADAVGFLVKSTNPSYVGGDTWGTEDAIGAKPGEDEPELLAEWEATLEAERRKVDRIAFAGQVPVNVTGSIPGQYIVPVATENGGITGIAKDEADLTLAEYMRAVGKVIAIENDGRARIIVKVA